VDYFSIFPFGESKRLKTSLFLAFFYALNAWFFPAQSAFLTKKTPK
jgi:hypothetical protein